MRWPAPPWSPSTCRCTPRPGSRSRCCRRSAPLAPRAVLCAYGLYAPVNARGLRRLGVDSVIGGEYEPHLLDLAERVRAGDPSPALGVVGDTAKITFRTPLRDALPALDRYAAIVMPDGTSRPTGFAEASRGCKHLCRHCPVVPVYEGRFRIVPVDVIVADVAQQVAAGARHISFGDPDFLNGPTHALRVARALHEAFPEVTWDATVKIEHIVRYPGHVETMAEAGCLFLVSAVESIDDGILERLAKGHTAEDFERAVAIARAAGLHLTPTFVPFTPWTTVEGYRALLARLAELALVESVPRGPALHPTAGAGRLAPVRDRRVREPRRSVRPDDMLGWPWRHPDPAVDALQARVQAIAETAADAGAGASREAQRAGPGGGATVAEAGADTRETREAQRAGRGGAAVAEARRRGDAPA